MHDVLGDPPATPTLRPSTSARGGGGRARPRDALRTAASLLAITAVLVVGAAAAASASGQVAKGGSTPGPGGAVPAAAAGYRLPVTGASPFARPFRAPAERWSSGHRGLDLWLDAGAPVLAPAGGTVVFAGTVVDRGVVSVLHPDGRRSSLEPVDPGVTVGQPVLTGDVLGTLQALTAHCAPRTCLHWGLREGDRYLDPLTVLPGAGPVVLLPVDGPG